MSITNVRPLPIPAPVTGGLWFHNHARMALQNARNAAQRTPQHARHTRPTPKGAVLTPGPSEDTLHYLMRGGGELENY